MSKKAGEVRSGQVKISDAFWSQMQEKVIDVVIPFQEKVLNDEVPGVAKSHAIENFRIAAGLSQGEFYGMVFQDSDMAKWLEGVAYSLTVKPDSALEARADDIIEIIEKAQQPDGYLDTYFIVKEPERRWQNLHECHELYCAGHMMEAGAAYYEATGKDRLLRVVERLADHIISLFGPEGEKSHGIPGHQEVEIGLMKLYHVTGKEKYRDMARHFLEERGKNPDYFYEEKMKRGWQHWGQYSTDKLDVTYNQAHETVYEQKEAVGHAVRALYMYTAMADLAGADGDEKLYQACRTLWENVVNKKMYITGALGGNPEGESFSSNYELPNDMAYAETCASIAMVFFAHRMLEMEMDGCYADIMEKELYNSTISGMQLDGKKYFYVNPLECEPGVSGKLFGYRHSLPMRPGWYACACCPPNLVRLITSLGKYCWSENDSAIYSHLMIGQKAELEKAQVIVDTSYPWEGKADYTIMPKTEEEFTLAIHIPGYVDFEREENCLRVNGEILDAGKLLKKGYVYITRKWTVGDKVSLRFPLEVRRAYANQHVRENAGCVALLRGPMVYCFEGVDNGEMIQSLRIPKDLKAIPFTCEEGVLKGNVLLSIEGYRMVGSDELYSEKPPVKEKAKLTAVPYYTWANRGENQMRVWMQEE
ncbi:glycoside hydrolase family 127 protein [Acetatifactor muris]|uniref:Non-reducing end beta-L-arabinofuranosidase n=1 Tax=Acetatifactor muris TaxID=879566 RepID=A0A2K4ZDB6_9FIRM|nr:beta-L-arabinofuranosidase domain-containing protein [Acetatifactor muris]MCI8799396.1 glycoside hydrolase family 127 protein [Lachnospiraceae bacterium]MCR2046955.1 glycoside hydrolase family 127 protein [Acetatifactor muris]SOY28454.1 Non-reducing end beta-L-arabinofuranosidase [Acetatifactor muris]